jgi:regulator of sigma E protease
MEAEGQPVFYQDEVTKIVRARAAEEIDSKTISFKVKRGDEVLSFTEKLEGTQIGFLPMPIDKDELAHIRYSAGESIALGTSRAFGVIFVQLKAFKKIFGGDISLKKSISGPIGMAQAFGTEWDWERFWRMTGLLSMVLAFMNLLPIPALDGGYVMFLLYEMITGKEPSEKFFETALKIGMAVLLLLMVFVFYNDIANLFNRG